MHQWAAEGLANTCWATYADHTSGLGPDEVKFTNYAFVFDDPEVRAYLPESMTKGLEPMDGLVTGRWMDHFDAWKKAGRPGGVPPGVRDPQPVLKGERDYKNQKSGYYLRPEVSNSCLTCFLLLTLASALDC